MTDAIVTAATGGDRAAFSELASRHRGELQAHCHRMLGSSEDSEDVVQETFLRAWRSRASFRGDASFRAWLYRIATNACHDALNGRSRRPQPAEGSDNGLVEEIAATGAEPDAAVVSKETTELALGAAIRHLPPRQRTVLVLCGALGLSAKDAAALLEASVPSVNSALQRARRTLKHALPELRLEWTRGSDASEYERALLHRYLEAIERADAVAFVQEAMSEQASVTIAPQRRRPRAEAARWLAENDRTALRGDAGNRPRMRGGRRIGPRPNEIRARTPGDASGSGSGASGPAAASRSARRNCWGDGRGCSHSST